MCGVLGINRSPKLTIMEKNNNADKGVMFWEYN